MKFHQHLKLALVKDRPESQPFGVRLGPEKHDSCDKSLGQEAVGWVLTISQSSRRTRENKLLEGGVSQVGAGGAARDIGEKRAQARHRGSGSQHAAMARFRLKLSYQIDGGWRLSPRWATAGIRFALHDVVQ